MKNTIYMDGIMNEALASSHLQKCRKKVALELCHIQFAPMKNAIYMDRIMKVALASNNLQ